MLIRQETATDYERIDMVHRSAFADQAPGAEPVEVGLVRELRNDVGYIPALSLVAEDTEGSVIGHVICTLGHLEGARAVGLGPISCTPVRVRVTSWGWTRPTAAAVMVVS